MYIVPPPTEYVILVANRKGLNCEFDIVFNFKVELGTGFSLNNISPILNM